MSDDSPKKRKLSEVNPYQQISDSEESTSSSDSDSGGSEPEDESATYPDDDTSDDDNLHEEPPDMRVYPEFLKNLPGVQSSDSMGYRIEALRVYLET